MGKQAIEISVIVPVEKTGSDLIEFFKHNRFFRNYDTEVLLITPDKKTAEFCNKFIYNDYARKAKIKIIDINDQENFVPKAFNTGAMLCLGNNVVFMTQHSYIYCERWETFSEEIKKARKIWGNKFWFRPEMIRTLSRKNIRFPQENQADFILNFSGHKLRMERGVLREGLYWFDFFCMDKGIFLSINGFEETQEWNFGANNLEKRIEGLRTRQLKTSTIKGIYAGKPTDKKAPYDIGKGIPILRETTGEHPRTSTVSELNLKRNPVILKSWEYSELPDSSSLYHHIDQKLHDHIISGKYSDLDVLHLGFFFFNRHSIFKIVQNVVHHAKNTKQNWLCLQDHKIEEVFEFCNIVQPKIIHIHFSEIIDESAFQFLKYSPKIVGTIHSQKLMPYSQSLDFLICINSLSHDLNRGSRKIIENTVWVDEHLVREKIDEHPDFCLTARFSPFVLSKETIQIYSHINSDVWIYGHTQDYHSNKLKSAALRYPNLNVVDWDNYIERMISRHSVFSVIKPILDSSYQYDMNVMEAAALGMPCITTQKRQDYQKYVIDGHNGFIVSDSNEFIDRCNLLVSDHNLFSEMKKNALAHRKTIVNNMPERYEEVYLSLIL